MKTQETHLETLESTTSSKANEQKVSKLVSISQAPKFFFESILRTDKPKIYKSRDKLGNVFWTVCNPFIDHRVFFNSETEVRTWLDRRYYQ